MIHEVTNQAQLDDAIAISAANDIIHISHGSYDILPLLTEISAIGPITLHPDGGLVFHGNQGSMLSGRSVNNVQYMVDLPLHIEEARLPQPGPDPDPTPKPPTLTEALTMVKAWIKA